MDKHEVMSGKERFLTTLGGGLPDRVPIFLRDLTLGLDITGHSTPEVCGGGYDPVKSAQAVLASRSRFNQDAMVGCIHFVGLEAQALGGEVSFPERGIPAITRHPFSRLEEFDSIDVPDMSKEQSYRGVLDSYGIVSKKLKDRAAVVCNLEGPMTKAALLRGLEAFALDLHLEPSRATEMVRFSVSLSEQFLEETSRRGADVLFVAAATDNPGLFGEMAFREHTLPGVGRLVRKARDLGMGSIFHPHGVFSGPDTSLMEGCIATGAQGIQFAEGNDFVPLKGNCLGKVSILGGIDAFSTLLLGPHEKIDEETAWFMRTCSPGGGYIFMCSCSLHRGMPLENVDAMIRSCLRHGHYRG